MTTFFELYTFAPCLPTCFSQTHHPPTQPRTFTKTNKLQRVVITSAVCFYVSLLCDFRRGRAGRWDGGGGAARAHASFGCGKRCHVELRCPQGVVIGILGKCSVSDTCNKQSINLLINRLLMVSGSCLKARGSRLMTKKNLALGPPGLGLSAKFFLAMSLEPRAWMHAPRALSHEPWTIDY